MSKVLSTAALVVGAVAIGVATWGLAAPEEAAAFASEIGFSSVATLTTTLGLATTGLGILAQVTASKPGTGGSATTFKADPNAGVPYMIGRTANAGNIVYRRTYNTPGYGLPDLQAFVVVLSGAGPIDAIESFQSDKPTQVYDSSGTLIATTNTTVTFDGTGNAEGYFNGWMWQTQQLGACPEPAALAKTSTGPYPPDWDASSKLSGKAAAMWTLRYDQKGKYFVNGVPAPTWVARGVKVYDPRLDSTYPGGSGPQRALNEATYAWSENPYLHALTFILGRFQNGAKVFGVGQPLAGVDVAAYVEGANVADANGWKVGGVIYSADDKWSVIKKMLEAGSGEPIHLGALVSCRIDTPRVVLDTVTDADTLGEVAVPGTQARRERINAILPTYRSEEHLWEQVAALTAVTVPAYITEDGGLRQKPYTFDLVQDVDQAAVLCRYRIENAREFGPVTLPLKVRWMGYKPGDCIAATHDETGLAAQPLIILNRNLNPATGAVTLTCRSETAAKHAFALGQTGTAPPTPQLSGPPIVPVPADGAWAITATGLTAAGSTIPALVIAGAATNLAIDGIIFEYREWTSGMDDAAGWIAAGSEPAAATGKQITGLLSGTQYEVGVSYTLGQQIGPRSVLGPVTTAGVAVDFAAGVTGAGKPDNNATASDNMIANGSLAAGSAPWVLSGGVVWDAAGAATDPSSGHFLFPIVASNALAAANGGAAITLTGATKLYVDGWSHTAVGSIGILTVTLGFLRADGSPSTITPFSQINIAQATLGTWLPFSAIVPVPADAVSATASFLSGPRSGAPSFATNLRVAKTQLAADVTGQNTANDTANVGGVPSSTLVTQAGNALMMATAAGQQLSDIAADGVFSPIEKKSVLIPQQERLSSSATQLLAAAATVGVTTEATAVTTAQNSYNSFLAAITPNWNNDSVSSPVDRAGWNSVLNAYEAALAALNKAVVAKAATQSTWIGLSGTGKPADNADVTATNAPSIAVPAGVTVNFDYTGTIVPGQLPITLQGVRKRGNTDISTSATWAVTGYGCTVSVDSTGLATLTAVSATGFIAWTATDSGVTLTDQTILTKNIAAPPATGDGGGSSGGTAAYTSSIAATSSTSYGASATGILTVTAGSAGTITFSAPLNFNGSGSAYGKWQLCAVGGTMADVPGGEIAASDPATAATRGFPGEPGDPASPGDIYVSQSKTGLTPGQQYQCQLLLRRASGSGTLNFSGTAAAVGS